MKTILLGLIVCLALVNVGQCDWNLWGGGNNGVHSQPVFRTTPTVRWSYRSTSLIKGLVVIDYSTGDVLIPDQDGALARLFSKNGTEIQQFIDPDGGRSAGSMTYRDSVLYILNDQTCKILAFDASTGQILWSTEDLCVVNGNPGTYFSPMLWNSTGYNFFASTSTFTYSIQASNGEILWATEIPSKSEAGFVDSQLMPPIFSAIDQTILVRSKAWLSKMDPIDGSVLWSVQVISINLAPGQPAIDSYGSIYLTERISEYTGAIFKYDINGTSVWSNSFFGSWSHASKPLLIDDEHFFFGTSNGNIFVVDTDTGVFNRSLNVYTPFLGDIKAQMIYSDQVLYVVSASGFVFGFDASNIYNLTLLWNINSGVNMAGYGGVSVDSDGTMYVGGISGTSAYPTLVSIGCPTRKILSNDGLQCVCPENSLGENCVSCASNEYYNSLYGCQICLDGQVPSDDQTQCDQCPANTFSLAGDSECRSCTESPSNSQCIGSPANPQSSPTNTPQRGVSTSSSLLVPSAMILCLLVL